MNRIVYAEDENLYGEVIKQLHNCVRKKFYDEVEFVVVSSWDALCDSVKAEPPSVILLDLGLAPDSPETVTLESLRKNWWTWPPVMVLTGNKFNLDLRRTSILAGADDFMIKDEANHNPEYLCERLYNCYLRRLRDEARA